MTTPTGQQSPLEELGVSYIHVSTLSPTNITSLKEAFFENLLQCILGENWGISTMLNVQEVTSMESVVRLTGLIHRYKLGTNVPTGLCYTLHWPEEDQHHWNPYICPV